MSLHAFSSEDTNRIRLLLQKFENGLLTDRHQGPRKELSQVIETRLGEAAEDIAALSTDQSGNEIAGSGDVLLYKVDTLEGAPNVEDVIQSTGVAITAFNVTDEPIKSGDDVFLLREPVGGRYLIIRTKAKNGLIRFSLTATLAYNGSTTAKKLEWDDVGLVYDKVGDEITVVASLLGIWGPAPIGATGWAVYMQDRDVYEIVFMQRFALFVTATTTDVFQSMETTATVDYFWRGLQPTANPITLVLPAIYTALEDCFPIGTKCVAAYDEKTDKYNIIEINPPQTIEVCDLGDCPDEQVQPCTGKIVKKIMYGQGLTLTTDPDDDCDRVATVESSFNVDGDPATSLVFSNEFDVSDGIADCAKDIDLADIHQGLNFTFVSDITLDDCCRVTEFKKRLVLVDAKGRITSVGNEVTEGCTVTECCDTCSSSGSSGSSGGGGSGSGSGSGGQGCPELTNNKDFTFTISGVTGTSCDGFEEPDSECADANDTYTATWTAGGSWDVTPVKEICGLYEFQLICTGDLFLHFGCGGDWSADLTGWNGTDDIDLTKEGTFNCGCENWPTTITLSVV